MSEQWTAPHIFRQQAMDTLVGTKQGANQKRWQNAVKDKAFSLIRRQAIIETQGERLLSVIQNGTALQ